MIYKLENEMLTVTFTPVGASIESVAYRDQSMLWNKDPQWWGRVAPFLFPVVGKLKDDMYTYDSKTYHMSQHGFLRDTDFVVVEHAKNKIEFVTQSSEATRKQYPFEFRINITYILDDASVKTEVSIHNLNDTPMYYSFGYHPAYLISGEEAYVEINAQQPLHEVLFEGPYRVGERTIEKTVLKMDEFTQNNTTFVYEGVTSVVLHDALATVSVDLGNYKQVGIWRAPGVGGAMSPFVCIEPWVGYGDRIDTNHNLVHKSAIEILDANASTTLITTTSWSSGQ